LVAGIDINEKDKYKQGVLMHASREEHSEVIELLLEKDAKIDEKNNNGKTAFDYVSRMRNAKVSYILIEQLLPYLREVQHMNS
jgi:ankyrin repeat protein